MKKLVINADGGSRGNPGPAAIGFVLRLPDGRVAEKGEYLGERTNNEAEYESVIHALKKAKALLGKEECLKTDVEVRMDSELAVRQMSGEYEFHEERLWLLFRHVWNLKTYFKSLVFKHVPREQNAQADALVNKTLDQATSTLF